MGIEVEKKYRLDEVQRRFVLDALRGSGARYEGEEREENTIYGGGILDENRAVLRVRKTGGKTVLTYKRRVESERGVKRQIEHETAVGDAGEIDKIVESLGFRPRLVYEKRRRTWKFRETEIVLDELPFGLFMEIEGRVEAIADAEKALKIEDFETVHETYPELTLSMGRRNGEIVEARF
jgi:adenylate cyclase class 2